MRILLITDGIWPYVLGGMQKHSFYLCKYFAKNKIPVHLIHFNQSNYDIEKLEFFTNEEKKFITHTLIDFPKKGFLPGHYLRNSYYYSKQIFDTLKNKINEFDFIYSKGFTAWYFIEQKKKGVNLPPIGVKFHGYEMFQKAPDYRIKMQHLFLLQKPVKYLSQNADVVFSYGGKITEIIRSLGVAPEKIIESPSGIEKENLRKEIKKTGEKIRFVFLGRYERRKGIEEINIALKQIENPTFEFHFIGPIPEEKKIKSSAIFYHGEIRDKIRVNEILQNCDVLVCPSWSEGMPNVILEAMSQGLAVIATDVGATNVAVNHETGWLLPDSDPEVLARIFTDISHTDPALINEKKNKALERISENFLWENLILTLTKQIKARL